MKLLDVERDYEFRDFRAKLRTIIAWDDRRGCYVISVRGDNEERRVKDKTTIGWYDYSLRDVREAAAYLCLEWKYLNVPGYPEYDMELSRYRDHQW